MIGGQWLDIRGDGAREELHRLKTGALFSASVGCALAALDVPRSEQLPWRVFAADVGLLFQIVDDILDGDGFVLDVGVDGARNLADGAAERALQELGELDADTERAGGDRRRPCVAHSLSSLRRMPFKGRLGALAERNFRLVFSSTTISAVGDGVTTIALAFAVLEITSSASALGIVLAARQAVGGSDHRRCRRLGATGCRATSCSSPQRSCRARCRRSRAA